MFRWPLTSKQSVFRTIASGNTNGPHLLTCASLIFGTNPGCQLNKWVSYASGSSACPAPTEQRSPTSAALPPLFRIHPNVFDPLIDLPLKTYVNLLAIIYSRLFPFYYFVPLSFCTRCTKLTIRTIPCDCDCGQFVAPLCASMVILSWPLMLSSCSRK